MLVFLRFQWLDMGELELLVDGACQPLLRRQLCVVVVGERSPQPHRLRGGRHDVAAHIQTEEIRNGNIVEYVSLIDPFSVHSPAGGPDSLGAVPDHRVNVRAVFQVRLLDCDVKVAGKPDRHLQAKFEAWHCNEIKRPWCCPDRVFKIQAEIRFQFHLAPVQVGHIAVPTAVIESMGGVGGCCRSAQYQQDQRKCQNQQDSPEQMPHNLSTLCPSDFSDRRHISLFYTLYTI